MKDSMNSSRVPLASIIFIFSIILSPAIVSGAPEPGRNLIRNGRFLEDPDHPVHWVTRGTGKHGSPVILPPETEGASATLSVDVKSSSSRPWDLEFRQALAEPIQAGTVALVRFDYKITEGYAFHCYWQKDLPPWPKLFSVRVSEPPNRWQTCTMAVEIHEGYESRQTSLTFHLAEKRGSVQFRNFSFGILPPGVPARELEISHYPVLGGDYHDSQWRKQIAGRVKKTRCARLALQILEDGQPLKNRDLTVEQLTHSFLFGVELPAPLLDDNILKRPPFRELREAIKDVTDRLERYRQTVTDRTLFNMIQFRDAYAWQSFESWGRRTAPTLGEDLAQRGFLLRGHALFCPAFRFAPPELRGKPAGRVEGGLYNFIRQQVSTSRESVCQWDVVHAPLTYSEIYELIGTDSLVKAFKAARQADKRAILCFSDDRSLLAPSPDHLTETLALITWLQKNEAEIEALAIEAEMTRPYVGPQSIEERLNMIWQATELPIIITSLTVEATTEQIQADRFGDLMLQFFSHPAVTGICLGEIWEAVSPAPKSALFRQNFVIKPAGQMYRKLVDEDWRTKRTVTTDENGKAVLTGFLGDYRVSVKDPEGKTVTKDISLPLEGIEATIELGQGQNTD